MSTRVDEIVLSQPIPLMDELRALKANYRKLPINRNDLRSDEPLVSVSKYNLAGQSYYSRENPVTKTSVPGVPTEILLRASVVKTLATINDWLRSQTITKFFGGEVELYIEEGLRSIALQTALHDKYIPALLRKQHQDEPDEKLRQRLTHIIAFPSTDRQSPSPHATGGAFDITLRFRQPSQHFVRGSNVLLGMDADTGTAMQPDYYEQHQPNNDNERLIQKNRRAFYAIMTGKAFGIDSEFACNPTEWWHWGRGDQLSEKIKGNPGAYYAAASSDN